MKCCNFFNTGWGTTSPSGEYSDVLRKEEVLIWSQVECSEVLGQVDASQMCAGPQEKVKGSCLVSNQSENDYLEKHI